MGEGGRQAQRHRAPHSYRRPVDAAGRPPGPPGARTRRPSGSVGQGGGAHRPTPPCATDAASQGRARVEGRRTAVRRFGTRSGAAPRSRSQQPAPALSNCRKRAIGRRPPCRRTTHGTSSQRAAPSPSSATLPARRRRRGRPVAAPGNRDPSGGRQLPVRVGAIMRARRLGLTTTSAQRTRCTESAPRRSTRPTLPGSRRGPRRRAPAMTASSSPTAQYRLPRATTGAPSGITGFTRCERATPPYRSLPPRLESARRVHRGKRKDASSQPATGAPLNKNPRQNTTERRDHANRVPVQRRGLPSRTATATATATALPPPWRISLPHQPPACKRSA